MKMYFKTRSLSRQFAKKTGKQAPRTKTDRGWSVTIR